MPKSQKATYQAFIIYFPRKTNWKKKIPKNQHQLSNTFRELSMSSTKSIQKTNSNFSTSRLYFANG